jgi:hypothetical protein
MVLTHHNPTSTNEKTPQLLTSISSIKEEPIQIEKNPIYEEPSRR